MVRTIICEVITIMCDIGTINVRFYLLKIPYKYIKYINIIELPQYAYLSGCHKIFSSINYHLLVFSVLQALPLHNLFGEVTIPVIYIYIYIYIYVSIQ
jgi:hypothetical protein